jgi:hypothetical protein
MILKSISLIDKEEEEFYSSTINTSYNNVDNDYHLIWG